MPRKASGKPRVDIVNRPQKNGDIYVYEVTSKYNPAKRYNETLSSKLLGKIPKGETEMVSTRPRRDPKREVTEALRLNVGVTDILSWIGKKSGIDKDIYDATDKGTAQKILSIAWFWTSNQDKAIRHIEEWQINHSVPYADGLSEDTCYLLMKQLGIDITISQKYFQNRAAHATSKASVAVDTTTISSYSEHLNDVRFGYNKDGNGLATVKLLTLFSLKDHQPIAFMRQPGNIPDVISVLNALKQLSVLGMNKPLVVLDGGFFSDENIFTFMQKHTKFLMRGTLDGRWIRPELDSVMDTFETPSNVCPYDSNVYGTSRSITLQFDSGRKYTRNGISKGDIVSEEHRLYMHFYLNVDKARIDKAALLDDIKSVKQQLEQGVDEALLTKSEQNIVDKYLVVNRTPKRFSVRMDDDAILKETRYYGYFMLLSNNKMATFEALREYRLREKTEEGFRIDKQYNDAHVTRSKTTTSLEGRFFCQFVAYGYEEFFQNEINRVKGSLAIPNGDPAHDNSETFKKEKALLNWLNKMSVSKLFNWFDAVQETTVNTRIAKNRWRTETIERDRLFLRKLGVIK